MQAGDALGIVCCFRSACALHSVELTAACRRWTLQNLQSPGCQIRAQDSDVTCAAASLMKRFRCAGVRWAARCAALAATAAAAALAASAEGIRSKSGATSIQCCKLNAMLAANLEAPGFGRLSPEVGALLLVPLAENRGTAGLAFLGGAGMSSAAFC